MRVLMVVSFFDSSNNPVVGQSGLEIQLQLSPIGLPGGVYYVRISDTRLLLAVEDSM
jgi:hypothetical protein